MQLPPQHLHLCCIGWVSKRPQYSPSLPIGIPLGSARTGNPAPSPLCPTDLRQAVQICQMGKRPQHSSGIAVRVPTAPFNPLRWTKELVVCRLLLVLQRVVVESQLLQAGPQLRQAGKHRPQAAQAVEREVERPQRRESLRATKAGIQWMLFPSSAETEKSGGV